MGRTCDTHTGNKLFPKVGCIAVTEDTILEVLGVDFRDFFYIDDFSKKSVNQIQFCLRCKKIIDCA